MESIVRRLIENHRLLEVSAGDVKLRKFIYLYSNDDIYKEISKYYDQELSGYYIEWDYIYNTATNYTDSTDVAHAEKLKSLLSPEAMKSFKENNGVWGRDDYNDTVGVYQFISDKPAGIPDHIYNLLISRFKKK